MSIGISFYFGTSSILTCSQKIKGRNLPQRNHPLLGAVEGKGGLFHLLRLKYRHLLSKSKGLKGNLIFERRVNKPRVLLKKTIL
jgi:hypothetical protein